MNNVENYFAEQPSSQQEILLKLRDIIKQHFPKFTEELYGGVPCYGVNEGNKFGKFYLVGLKDHVNLGVSVKNLPDDVLNKLDKVGKVTGHIEFKNIDEINEMEILKILQAVK